VTRCGVRGHVGDTAPSGLFEKAPTSLCTAAVSASRTRCPQGPASRSSSARGQRSHPRPARQAQPGAWPPPSCDPRQRGRPNARGSCSSCLRAPVGRRAGVQRQWGPNRPPHHETPTARAIVIMSSAGSRPAATSWSTSSRMVLDLATEHFGPEGGLSMGVGTVESHLGPHGVIVPDLLRHG
jgi:hypothetical protein